MLTPEPSKLKDSCNAIALKAIGISLGFLILFFVGIHFASSARRYQLANEPMPNGKGGFMTFRDGYYIALVVLLMSLVWFAVACRFWRKLKEEDRNLTTTDK